MQIKSLPAPENGINLVCLIITAVSPAIAIGPIIGGAVGLVASFGLLAAMKYQADPSRRVRKTAYAAVWGIRIFILTMEQMAYQDGFAVRKSLPFGWTPETWGWIVPCFMAGLDLLAYALKAARAAAAAEAAEIAANLARADELDKEKHERKAAEEEAKRGHEIILARLAAETEERLATIAAKTELEKETKKAEEDRKKAEAEAEARKVESEEKRKLAEIASEEKRRKEEAERNKEERERKQAEDDRNRKEAERKEAERIQKEKQDAERQQREREAQKAAQERAEAATIAAEAERKARAWKDADTATRAEIIAQAEETAANLYNRKPTQTEVAQIIGVSDRTLRDFKNQHMQQQQQPA